MHKENGKTALNAQRTNIRFILLATVVALLSATAGFSLWQLQQIRSAPTLAALKVLPEPRVLADFDLVDQAGQPFSLERLRGKWSLLFFGFTYCPDICPGTLYDLLSVHNAGRQRFLAQPDMPATFTMAPSGARLPLRPTTPPVLVNGASIG